VGEEIRTLTTRAPSGSPNVRVVELDPEPTEVRVLGALLDKQRATPDPYPLSVNAPRAACNEVLIASIVRQLPVPTGDFGATPRDTNATRPLAGMVVRACGLPMR
jgi:hypothetical protein